jgi:hypothetical protein
VKSVARALGETFARFERARSTRVGGDTVDSR